MPNRTGVSLYFTETGKELEFYSIADAARYLNVSPWVIRDVIIGKRENSKILKSLNIIASKIDYEPVRKINYSEPPKQDGTKKVRVRLLDLYTNEIIDEYDSVKEAAEDNGVLPNNITRCCRGEIKYYLGYRWEYAV